LARSLKTAQSVEITGFLHLSASGSFASIGAFSDHFPADFYVQIELYTLFSGLTMAFRRVFVSRETNAPVHFRGVL